MKTIPIMSFGKYNGISMDKIPMDYLRWICTQDFPKDILEFASKKIGHNKTTNLPIGVSRHALDKYSLKYLGFWDTKEGFASFVTKEAIEALRKGKDVSKNRFKGDKVIIEHKGIKWVFNDSKLSVVTIM